jgi:hypothetical protein
MKILYAIIFLTGINLVGCYTVLWTPDKEFPTESEYYNNNGYSVSEDTYSDPYYTDVYYSAPNHGGYAYYYETPWWLSLNPPSKNNTKEDPKSERYEEIRQIRNGGGRNTDSTLDTPSRGGNNSGTTTNSAPSQNTETKRSDSRNKDSEERNNTRNSGERNSGSGRR